MWTTDIKLTKIKDLPGNHAKTHSMLIPGKLLYFMEKTFTIITLGCKVNQCESDNIALGLCQKGWIELPPYGDTPGAPKAALIIVNSCAVTQKGAMQSRQAVRKLLRHHPDATAVITGCYAQVFPEELEAIEGHTVVIGHEKKLDIPELAEKLVSVHETGNSYITDILKTSRFKPLEAISCESPLLYEQNQRNDDKRTRAFLKIQDGCDTYCTYCIVPHARGKSRSMPMEDVLANLSADKQKGYQETVLTGIHLGFYGRDLNPPENLEKLLVMLSRHRDRIPKRLRLSSIEPMELTNGILELANASDLLCRHFHIPLQSGDDDILNRMKRPYNTRNFIELVLRIKEAMSDASIGIDVMAGFPGETDASFERTCNLIKMLPITYLHVFPFSPRKGTPAYHFKDKVSSHIAKKRAKTLRELGMEKKHAYFNQRSGGTGVVLVESKQDGETGLLTGHTSDYIPVLLEGLSDGTDREILKNRFVNVVLKKNNDRDMMTGFITGMDHSPDL